MTQQRKPDFAEQMRELTKLAKNREYDPALKYVEKLIKDAANMGRWSVLIPLSEIKLAMCCDNNDKTFSYIVFRNCCKDVFGITPTTSGSNYNVVSFEWFKS